MGRPREHDEHTAEALLTAAEPIIEARGLGALSLRELAEEAGTTTRVVYSLFGSKEGLLSGLGARAFELGSSDRCAVPAIAPGGIPGRVPIRESGRGTRQCRPA